MDLAYEDLPAGMRLEVFHLHPDNSTRKQRAGSKYRTVARIIMGEGDNAEVIAEADARCSRRDAVSRCTGWHVAVGRVKAKILRPVALAIASD